jgi:hypothetical protein
MRFHTTTLLCRAVLAACLALAALVGAASAGAARPLQTAVIQYPSTVFEGPRDDTAFSRVRGTGAGVVKLTLYWNQVAPTRPAQPTDPSDSAYNWTTMDRRIRLAVTHGMQPLVMVVHAPSWASGANGWDEPDLVALAQFARAAATRYSGTYRPPAPDFPYFEDTLPRVRFWQAWNEPNLLRYLSPQYRNGAFVAPATYRQMVNRFTNAVKGIHPTNLVLAGGTAPFGAAMSSTPLAFMREFLCLRANLTAKPNCGPVRFDIWGHHPYTSGDPLHKALNPNDVSLGDLPKMRKVLRAAVAKRKIASSGRVRFWIDEFSWDTNPPDPGGVPMKLHARWTAEAMYRMWQNGVSLVAWLQIMDNRWTGRCGDPYQSGLYFWSSSIATARPKYSLRAFRFPFVAFPQRGRILVWGRTPGSAPGRVAIQRKVGSRWRAVGSFRVGANGVFQKRYARPWRSGLLRAKAGRATSVPFSLTRVPDRRVNAFGLRPGPTCG